MNVAGLELAAGQELDWDREFRVTGVASAVAGLGGGTISTIVVPASLRSKLLGASTRLTGVVAALVIATALVVGDGMRADRTVAAGRRHSGIRRPGHAGPGTGEEPQARALVGVRHHPADRHRHRRVRDDRRRGRRHARHPGVLRRSPEPGGPDRVPLYRARSAQQQGAPGARSRHPGAGGRAGACLPVARLPVFRQCLAAGRSPPSVAARRRPPRLHSARLRRRFRLRRVGGDGHGPLPAGGRGRRGAGGPERLVREPARRVATHPAVAGIRPPVGGAERRPRPGALRGSRDRGMEGGRGAR